jgi:hypothetical protein
VDVWTDARWLADVKAWLDRQLEEIGLQSTGAIEQPHVRAWSTVPRVPTTGGDVWFEANIPQQTAASTSRTSGGVRLGWR